MVYSIAPVSCPVFAISVQEILLQTRDNVTLKKG